MLTFNPRNTFIVKGDIFAMSVTIGDTRHQFVGRVGSSDEDLAITELGDLAQRAIKRGRTAIYADGSREWIAFAEVIAEDGEFIWHADSDRVRWSRRHVQVTADGARSERSLPPVWRQPS